MVTNSYQANSLNQYTHITGGASSPSELSYDLDGNLLSDGVSTYSWSGENRLIQVSNFQYQVSFSYDYMGRRFSKTVDSDETLFIYDGWNLIQETSSSVTNFYTWGLDLSQSLQGAGGVGGLLCVTVAGDGGPGTYFPCFDANGNITEYVDTNGVIVAHYEYGPFGQIIAQGGAKANDFHFRFSTKYLDAEIYTDEGSAGLYYYGYRYYDAGLGRWPSRDPIGIAGGFNFRFFWHVDVR